MSEVSSTLKMRSWRLVVAGNHHTARRFDRFTARRLPSGLNHTTKIDNPSFRVHNILHNPSTYCFEKGRGTHILHSEALICQGALRRSLKYE